MAYLRSMFRACVCGRRAEVELLNRHDGSHGQFCGRCGKRKLEELQRAERDLDRARENGSKR